MFLVVGDKTRCKPSFVVKSISAFVAPRGSSSNKVFTSIIIVLSLSGMFGASRWYAIGVASFDEARLAFIGFGALLLTAAFETDVSNARCVGCFHFLMIRVFTYIHVHVGFWRTSSWLQLG